MKMNWASNWTRKRTKSDDICIETTWQTGCQLEGGDPHLEEREDDLLVGFGEDREPFLIGEKDAGRKDGCFDRFAQPLFHHRF